MGLGWSSNATHVAFQHAVLSRLLTGLPQSSDKALERGWGVGWTLVELWQRRVEAGFSPGTQGLSKRQGRGVSVKFRVLTQKADCSSLIRSTGMMHRLVALLGAGSVARYGWKRLHPAGATCSRSRVRIECCGTGRDSAQCSSGYVAVANPDCCVCL